jgi:CheY-like chemotaxis protein
MLAYAGRSPLAFADVDINSIIEETSQLLSVSLGKRQKLELELVRPSPLIHADATQIRQVIMNLVLNASQAIGDKEGHIVVRTGTIAYNAHELRRFLADAALQPGRYLMIEVIDNGSGMAPEIVSRIFEPFFTTKSAGQGLGLAAVLGIIKSHNGAVAVESAVGKGTLFRVIFPALEKYLSNEPKTLPLPKTWKGSGSILVVDDEAEVRSMVARSLENLGFITIPAASAAEAIQQYVQHAQEIRLVLLDLTMPLVDGEQVFLELRHLNPQLPIVLMSGFSEKLSLNRFVSAKPTAFLAKPFNQLALQDCLQQLDAAGILNRARPAK